MRSRATRVEVAVARVVVTGAGVSRLGTSALESLIASAVARELAAVTLPAGQTVRTAVRVEQRAARGGQALADAVGIGVARAVGGRSRG